MGMALHCNSFCILHGWLTGYGKYYLGVEMEIDIKSIFTREDHASLMVKVMKRGTHHLFFGKSGIDIVRSDGIDNRDSRLWIAKYKSKTLPPYELVLVDINYAISEYERENQISGSQPMLESVG